MKNHTQEFSKPIELDSNSVRPKYKFTAECFVSLCSSCHSSLSEDTTRIWYKDDKERACIGSRSRHVNDDITWVVWPWTRFSWRETAILPPGLYKWKSSRKLFHRTDHTERWSSKSCINPILATLILSLSPLKLCLCLMLVHYVVGWGGGAVEQQSQWLIFTIPQEEVNETKP